MKKLLFLLFLCTSICTAQQRASDFTASGPITANGADCNTTNACISLHMPASNVGYSIAVSGSWTGTLTVEQSANNQTTWSSVTTTTSNTLYSSALTPGITDVRVRGSAAMTGTAQITISASGPALINNITQIGGSGTGLSPVSSGLVAQCPLTETTGTTISCGAAGSGTLGTTTNAPLFIGQGTPGTPLFMDSFVQSGGTLSSNWTTIDGTFAVASNAVGASALGTLASARISSIPWNIPSTNKFLANSAPTMDQYSCTTAVVVPTGAVGIGPAVRLDSNTPPNNNYYALEWQGPGTNSFRLYQRLNTVFTALNTTAGTYNVGDVLCLSAVGNTLTFTKNGVNIAAPVTSTVIQNGFPGIAASGTTATSGTVGRIQAGIVVPTSSGGLLFGGGQFVTLPASLNTAQTLMTYSCSQKSQNASATSALIQGNGNGSNSNANGIHLATNGSADSSNVVQTLPHIELVGGSAYVTAQQGMLNGCGVVTAMFGTSGTSLDQIFINNTEGLYNQNLIGASAALQTVGAYQLGGAASGSGFGSQTYFTGQQYYWLFYNRKLTNTEVLQNVQFLNSTMAARGVNIFNGDVQAKGSCVAAGDSIMAGFGLSGGQAWTEVVSLNVPANTETYQNGGFCWNQGVTAATQAEMNRVHAIDIDPLFSLASTRNVEIIAGCSNDLFYGMAGVLNSGSASQCLAQQAQEARQAHAAGWKVLATTILSRSYNGSTCTTGDTNKDLINPLIRNNWSTYADGLVDIGETLTMGADTTCTGTSFNGDKIHPSQFGSANTLAPLMQHAIDKLYGPQDFSQASVYNSAAPAAVATTSGTSAGQIATVVFGATPCVSGQTCTIAGVTPAGYNGTFFVLPGSTATTITYTTSGSNLGAISVQGTGVAPQQRSQDKYMIVNFGAGNFTLDSCAGYTGQNIYIRNINAAGTTLVPLGSETITGGGATPTTLAAASTAILQSQLVSNTAGGCNWVRIQ